MTATPSRTQEGPGSLLWILSGAIGFVLTTFLIGCTNGFAASPGGVLLCGCLFGVPAGLLVATAGYSARTRQRGWIVLLILVAAVLAAWLTLFAIDTYQMYQSFGPHPLF